MFLIKLKIVAGNESDSPNYELTTYLELKIMLLILIST